MHADRVELSWDASKSSWLLRIEAGEEVIRRHCALPKSADEPTLRTAIEKAVADEGYEMDPASLVRR
jgi:hypothetical protein